jgi:hypothetical protein
MADEDDNYGEGVDPAVLRSQVDQLTPAAKKLVAERLTEIEREKAPPPDTTDYAHMPESEFRQILHKYT